MRPFYAPCGRNPPSRSLMALLWVMGCASGVREDGAQPRAREVGPESLLEGTFAAQNEALTPLSGPRLVRRLSLDLRGVLPGVEELDNIETDAERWTEIRDTYLADPRFEERVVVLLGERWLTRTDEFLIQYNEYPSLGSNTANEYPFERAVGEEPLRLMARIAARDLPYREVVTADWTMAHSTVAEVWPLEYPEGELGWQEANYTDERPPAGVLATNGLWWRYPTTFSNYNRGRAAALARLLLCEDVLARPVSFGEGALGGTANLEDALRENPTCVSCHSSVDPLAATLFGFWSANEYSGVEAHRYHPEREHLGSILMDVEPAWFGTPIGSLAELGQAVAADPRFERCAVETWAGLLWRKEVVLADFERIETLLPSLNGGEGTTRDLIRAITADPLYQAGVCVGDACGDVELSTERLVEMGLLRSVVADFAGLRWLDGGFDLLDSDTTGFRALGGGVDGAQVSRPQVEPGLTWALVHERVAEATARSLVPGQVGVAGTPLSALSLDDRPGDPGFEQTLEALAWRLWAVRLSETERDALATLWELVEAEDGAEGAWVAVISVMMRDPLFVTY